MVPVTFDVILRVLGHSFVFVFAPIVGVIGGIGKVLASAATAFNILPLGSYSHPGGVASFCLGIFAGITTPIVYLEASIATKCSLKKNYALNRICMSTILLIEIATVLVLTTNANVMDIRKGTWFLEVNFRMPTEVDEQVLDCTNICPIAVYETNRNLTLTENFTTLENLTNLTHSGNSTFYLFIHADVCLTYVAISQSGFFALATFLMVLALYTIIESILMLCNIRTLSDCLLFDHGDLPDKVLSTNYMSDNESFVDLTNQLNLL